MSGGVDSAVAAARAVEAGHDVVGVHLALSRMPGTLRTGSRGCCTIEDSMDAQRAANTIGIPYYVWDFSERFKLDVVDDFVADRCPRKCAEDPEVRPLMDVWLAMRTHPGALAFPGTVLEQPAIYEEAFRVLSGAADLQARAAAELKKG